MPGKTKSRAYTPHFGALTTSTPKNLDNTQLINVITDSGKYNVNIPGAQKKHPTLKFKYLSFYITDWSQTFTESSIYKWGEVVTILCS